MVLLSVIWVAFPPSKYTIRYVGVDHSKVQRPQTGYWQEVFGLPNHE